MLLWRVGFAAATWRFRVCFPASPVVRMMTVVSRRIRATEAPVIVAMQRLIRGTPDPGDVLSLAQGIVHWAPPAEAVAGATEAIASGAAHSYCADDGLPALRDGLRRKLAAENSLVDVDVMVTSGANQAFTNMVLALLDSGDGAFLFTPYYFNHHMALTMTGVTVLTAPMTDALQPDLDALEIALESGGVKLVVLINPGNPTGTLIPRATLEAARAMCAQSGAWLVVDNTYEHFVYDDEGGGVPQKKHECVGGPAVVNLFSFSKAYGLMGWRVGYTAAPPALTPELLKAQDTVAICANVAAQHAALGALNAGRLWVDSRVSALAEQKALVYDALAATLGPDAIRGGSGAIYFIAKLPPHRLADENDAADAAVVKFLLDHHGVATIPGSACGHPGHIRVCYANLPLDRTRQAADRLKSGLRALIDDHGR